MKLAVTSCVSIILILAAEEVRSVEEPVPHTTWKRRRSRLSDIKGIQTRGGGSTIDDGPYSFSLTTFSPRGSLNQLEYAMNAASAFQAWADVYSFHQSRRTAITTAGVLWALRAQAFFVSPMYCGSVPPRRAGVAMLNLFQVSLGQKGALSVAITYDTGIALASVRKAESSLAMDIGTRKVARVADGAALSYSGLAADSRVLIKRAQAFSLGYQGKFGKDESPSVGVLVSEISRTMQEYTQMAGVRPFGVALLVASVDANGVQLYRIEPSGSCSRWKACATGKGSAEAETMLHDTFEEAMDRDSALRLLLSVILRCSSSDVGKGEVEIAFVEKGMIETVATTSDSIN